MNFFKRKFSLAEDERNGEDGEHSAGYGQGTPPVAFSFSEFANRLSSTISAPTSPARTGEPLSVALERSLGPSGRAPPPAYSADAKILLVIEEGPVDWSKYFRPIAPSQLSNVRVEQATFRELNLMCTESACIVELNQDGNERHFTPHAILVASGSCEAASSPSSAACLRALLASRLPFLNSPLKKEIRRLLLKDGSKIPFLPSIHYPNFHKFVRTLITSANHFPIVVSIGNTRNGQGKMKISSAEELSDLQGMLCHLNSSSQVEVEPFVDVKYDLHVQKIGRSYKTFARRSISHEWKSNAAASVLEQIQTTPRHVEYVEAISSHLGGCQILSIDILVSRDNREFVHSLSDALRYFGESAEEDRRAVTGLLRHLLWREAESSSSSARKISSGAPPIPLPPSRSHSMAIDETSTFAEDTMGQLKKTFAGIFGDLA